MTGLRAAMAILEREAIRSDHEEAKSAKGKHHLGAWVAQMRAGYMREAATIIEQAWQDEIAREP